MRTHNLLIIFIFLLYPSVSSGEVYKWRDKEGKLHFTDKPPKDQHSKKLDEQQLANQISSFTNVTVKIEPIDFGVNRQVNMPIMYSTTRCGYCAKAREFFASEGIEFKEKNIDLSKQYRQEFNEIGGKGVPLIIYGRKRMNGFNVAKYKKTFSQN